MKKDLYAVFGHPISHSLSPLIHTAFAKSCGLSETFSYQAICPPQDGFSHAIHTFIAEGAKGANVTLPFKETAFALSDHLTERAKSARAVNTLSFTEKGIFGDNTDGVGLLRDLTDFFGYDISHKRILLLGAGGAARGVVFPLLQAKPSVLIISNRTLEKAQALVAHFQDDRCMARSFSELGEMSFDLLINATSLSVQGTNAKAFPLPPSIFSQKSFAYEMMYGKDLIQKSPFCQMAQKAGAHVADGLGMLIEQAAEAFFIWQGRRPDTHAVRAYLKTQSA